MIGLEREMSRWVQRGEELGEGGGKGAIWNNEDTVGSENNGSYFFCRSLKFN